MTAVSANKPQQANIYSNKTNTRYQVGTYQGSNHNQNMACLHRRQIFWEVYRGISLPPGTSSTITTAPRIVGIRDQESSESGIVLGAVNHGSQDHATHGDGAGYVSSSYLVAYAVFSRAEHSDGTEARTHKLPTKTTLSKIGGPFVHK